MASLMLLSGTRPVAADEALPSPLGRSITDFALQDYRGKPFRLAELSDQKLVVVAFLGTECPLAKLYAPRLQQLAEKYRSQGVAFVGIDANRQDGVTEIAQLAKAARVDFPMLKDVGNVVADQFGAVRTPEVFLLDGDRKVRYWGRIDDQYGIGYQRETATRTDLAAAIDDLLADRDVTVAETPAPGCRIGRVREVLPGSEVTYSSQVARILQERCVACHRPGEIAPFALQSYAEVAGWAETIREVIHDGRMPPWHANPAYGKFANDARLTPEEIRTIDEWVAHGAPEGDPAELPEAKQFTAGWQIDTPDAVFKMADYPSDIPAEGVVGYRHFVVDPGFTEDKWVVQAEARPGNRSIVHHIIIFVRQPGEGGQGHGGGFSGFLCAAAPGARPLILEPGQAKRIPAGSKLVFQMHYTPNGTPQEDLSEVGLVFTDAAKVTREVQTMAGINPFLNIPPGAPDHEVSAYKRFRRDTLLISLFPHMHLRGKAFRYTAKYPDGTEEILLDVPAYDFNWQNTYVLAEPKLLPKGTKLQCTARYDNSADNPANPDPTALVTFGEQTWEEMMIGFFDAAPAAATGPSATAGPSSADDSNDTDGD
ncbi:MAG: redoxin domain-containing protein [Pirellulales bacterium]|nr:redoxin domain-containing protein [Pirellulales bacterium]